MKYQAMKGHPSGGHVRVRGWLIFVCQHTHAAWKFTLPALLAGCVLFGLALPGAYASTPLTPVEDALASYAEARQASAAGQWDRAEILLERVLMLMPEHAEARVDFALLMIRRGQPDTAQQLLRGLMDDPRTPVEHRQRLAEMVGDLAKSPPSVRLLAGQAVPSASSTSVAGPAQAAWRGEVSWLASTNPQARTSASELQLTVAGGTVALPLATRPHAGHVTGLTLSRSTATGGADFAFQHLAQPAEGLEVSAHRASLWRSLLTRETWPLLPAGTEVQGTVQTQQGFDGLRRHVAGLILSKVGSRLSLLHYAEPEQDESGSVLRYEQRWALDKSRWPTVGAVMLERSASQRRPQGHWRMGFVMEASVSATGKLQLQFTAQQDTTPYSTLLENNAKRRLIAGYVGYEQQWPLGADVAFIGRVFAGRRSSNLELFNFQDAGVQLALVRQWR